MRIKKNFLIIIGAIFFVFATLIFMQEKPNLNKIKVDSQKPVYLGFQDELLKIKRWDREYVQIKLVHRFGRNVSVGSIQWGTSQYRLTRIVQNGNTIKLQKTKRKITVVHYIHPWITIAIFNKYRDKVFNQVINSDPYYYQIYVPKKAKLRIDGVVLSR